MRSLEKIEKNTVRGAWVILTMIVVLLTSLAMNGALVWWNYLCLAIVALTVVYIFKINRRPV